MGSTPGRFSLLHSYAFPPSTDGTSSAPVGNKRTLTTWLGDGPEQLTVATQLNPITNEQPRVDAPGNQTVTASMHAYRLPNTSVLGKINLATSDDIFLLKIMLNSAPFRSCRESSVTA